MYKSSTLHHPTGFGGGNYPYKYKMHGTTTTPTSPKTTTIHFSTLSIPTPRRFPEPSYNRTSRMSSNGTNTNAPTAAGTSAGSGTRCANCRVKLSGDHKCRDAGAKASLTRGENDQEKLEDMVRQLKEKAAEDRKW